MTQTYRHPWHAPALIVTCALAGCITITPTTSQPSPKASGAGSAAASPDAGKPGAKKPIIAERPKAGDAATLGKLRSQGRVQVSFKGLNGPARRALMATTSDIARVEVTLSSSDGGTIAHSLSREQMMRPVASLFFDRVPVGAASLTVKVFDFAGAPIGEDSQPFEVVGGKTTEVPMTIKLGATGGVAASVAFEAPEIDATNISGYWYIGGDGPAPDFPQIGCGEGYVWYITQVGDTVHATSSGYNSVIAPDHRDMWWTEEAYGTKYGNKLVLGGRVTYTDAYGNEAAPAEEADYALEFQPDRWQLLGSRNGRTGWAVPYYFDPGCGSATPPPLFPGTYPSPGSTPAVPWANSTTRPADDAGTLTLTGQVYDGEGRLQTEGMVTVSCYDAYSPFEASAPIDAAGRYRLEGVPVGYDILIAGSARSQAGSPWVTGSTWQVFWSFGADRTESFDIWCPGLAVKQDCPPQTYPIGLAGEAGCGPMFVPNSYPLPTGSATPQWYPSPGFTPGSTPGPDQGGLFPTPGMTAGPTPAMTVGPTSAPSFQPSARPNSYRRRAR